MWFNIRDIFFQKPILLVGFAIFTWSGMSCKKLVHIPPPANTITTGQVFADSLDATAAIDGIYSSMVSTQATVSFADGLLTEFTGLSGDELGDLTLNYPDLDYNILKAEDGITDQLWKNAYTYLYAINSCIQSVQGSSGLSKSAQNQFIGEAEFLRALCYFYLVNLYGDVPLILGTEYQVNESAPKTTSAKVYDQIVTDLKNAQTLLLTDYSISGGQRTRANQAAATALLARVYLYEGDFSDAALQATSVINNSAYSLLSDCNSVFLANSNEAILQWQVNPVQYPYNATAEGVNLLPTRAGQPPLYYLTTFLINAFDSGDLRYAAWVDSTTYRGTMYYYAYKYKIGLAQKSPTAPATEYYMVLRLAEQYLIRAEAEANGATGGDAAAITDLNVIRGRAGLTPLPDTLTPGQVLTVVAHERQVELFAEWGHRWFDLKRTSAIDSVMTVTTPMKGGNTTWAGYQQFYPIPPSEIHSDANLVQNQGY